MNADNMLGGRIADHPSLNKVVENRLRRTLQRRGFTLVKNRRRDPRALGFGGYSILDATGHITAGLPPDQLSLSDVQRWVDEP